MGAVAPNLTVLIGELVAAITYCSLWKSNESCKATCINYSNILELKKHYLEH